MRILYPYFFYFFFFLIIPIILYFIRKPDVKRRYFSAFILLKKAIDHHKKKINIRDIIILIIRTLIIISILTGASRPIINLTGGFNSFKAVFVIDNSLSLLHTYSDISDYKKKINEITDFYTKENNIKEIIYLYKWKGNFVFDRSLDRLIFSNSTFNINDVTSILERESDIYKNIFVITDNQLDKYVDKIPDNYNFIDVFEGWKDNLYVEKVMYEKLSFYPENKKIDVFIKNTGNKNIQCTIELFNENRLIEKREKLVLKDDTLFLDFDIKIDRAGINPFKIKLKGDSFYFDNEFQFAVIGREKIKIAYSGNTINPFLKKAFSFDERISPFIFVPATQANIENTDILLIEDLSNIKEDIKYVEKFLQTQKDIIILPSQEELFNKSLFYNNISPVSLFDNTMGNRKIVSDNYISRFSFYKVFFVKDFKKDEVLMYFDDMVPFIIKSKKRNSNVVFINMIMKKNSSDFISSPYFVYFWYKLFTEKIKENVKVFALDTGINIVDHQGENKYIDQPSIVKDNNSRFLIVNYPISERVLLRNVNNKVIKHSELMKGVSNIDVSIYFIVVALLLFIIEIYLKYNWGVL